MARLMTWLVPAAGPVRQDLVATIDRLASGHGSARFQPHVTLVANVDSVADSAAEALTSLTAAMTPIDVRFTAIGHEQTYFRALYLRPEPSAQLAAVHEAVQRAWALDPWRFRPHLSLLYSDIREEQKRPIIDSIGIALPLTVRFDAIELWTASQDVRDWYGVARIPFTISR
jgi:2'-5' RNA ligase